jgi:hypothetical protein
MSKRRVSLFLCRVTYLPDLLCDDNEQVNQSISQSMNFPTTLRVLYSNEYYISHLRTSFPLYRPSRALFLVEFTSVKLKSVRCVVGSLIDREG